jgi:hypothetical protein
MRFSVHVTGRRMSDGRDYDLMLQLDAFSEAEVVEHLDHAYDWTDAASRDIHIQPLRQ